MIKTLLLVSALQIAYGNPTNDTQSNRMRSKTAAYRLESETTTHSYPRADYKSEYLLTSGKPSHIDAKSTWKDTPVFCPAGTYAYGFKNRRDDPTIGDRKGITEIQLWCKSFGYKFVKRFNSETIESGDAIGDWRGIGGQCQQKKIRINKPPWSVWIVADEGDPAQFIVGAKGIFADDGVGAIQFAPICDMPTYEEWWEDKAMFLGKDKGNGCNGQLNRAQGGTATAQSEFDSQTTAAMAFAGPTTQWHSKAGMPQWLKYELSYKLPICKIRFSPRSNDEDGNTLSDCPKKYKIKGSNDNENFDELLAVELTDAEARTLCVPNNHITKNFDYKEPYQYYQLEVLDVEGRTQSNGEKKKYTVLGDVEFYSINDLKRPTQELLGYEGSANDEYFHRNRDLSEQEVFCPYGQLVCGINTRVSPTGFFIDESGINEIKIFCCGHPLVEDSD